MRLLPYTTAKRLIATLSPTRITEILSANEICLNQNVLPTCVKSIECNQLGSNTPIEDRIRISTIHLPDIKEPTLVMGVFDGHGGGITADLVTRRLFNYIALSLHPNPSSLKISSFEHLNNLVVDLHNSPKPPRDTIQTNEFDMLQKYKDHLNARETTSHASIINNLKNSFQRCDDDLSQEIQENLSKPQDLDQLMLHHYLSAAVSGCCAIVMVIHQGFAYMISSGDCRAVLGFHESGTNLPSNSATSEKNFKVLELNNEHNCDNIYEVRRLAAAHPKSEQNTMIKHNRLLGHLMPFRAFGDFNYKWPAAVTHACGITKVFGSRVIPANYNTPPYLIATPEVKTLQLDESVHPIEPIDKSSFVGDSNDCNLKGDRYIVMATDGLWEMFESSRDVIKAVVEHSVSTTNEDNADDLDANCATHLLRSALCFGPLQDNSVDPDRLRKHIHMRLESTLTLPRSISRSYRDDISIVLLKLP